MNLLSLRNLFIFIFIIFWQPSLAQSINFEDFQELLSEDPMLIKKIQQQDKTEEKKKLTSKNQTIANIEHNLHLDLSQSNNQTEFNEKSMLMRYFYALVGKNLNIYGSNEFNQSQDDDLLFFNTIGKNYQLAPGDTIQITITGLRASNDNYQVMNDGTITLENIYPINVHNLNLNQVSKLVLDKILLDDASAEVFVRLNSARLVTVQISGNVKSPRTIAVPAYTPLSRAIAYSGGVSESGSLRNILLSQIGEATQTVDFYDYLQNPSSKSDPLIKNGARIFIPFKGPTVAVTGLVNNPGIYELSNNESEILIENLISITGTSFLPTGAKLKVSYFDTNGQITTRLAVKSESIKEGEALQIDFVETRDLNISKISGAVLEDFEVKTNTPLSIKEVLKNGAVLNLDTYRSFAVIDGEDLQVINLNVALKDDNILLPLGSDLRLFTKEEYLALVATDPNKSFDPLINRIINSNIAELYLNGVRIAYIPVELGKELSNILKPFYIPNPKTVYELALIENSMNVKAFDLQSAMLGNYKHKLVKGDRLFIFEDNFFNQLIHEQVDDVFNDIDEMEQFEESNDTDLDIKVYKYKQEAKNNELLYKQDIEYTKKILQKSNIIRISLDGKLLSILPFSEGLTSTTVLNKLKGRLPKLTNEFVIHQNMEKNSAPKIRSINQEFKVAQNDLINFISQTNYRMIINDFDEEVISPLMDDVRESDAVRVYLDEKLFLLLSPNVSFSKQKIFDKIIKLDDFYRLYIGLRSKQKKDKNWNFSTYDAATFFSDLQGVTPSASSIVYMFSQQYIRDNFLNSRDKEELLKNTYKSKNNENKGLVIEKDTFEIDSLEQINTEMTKNESSHTELKQSNNNISNHVLQSMRSNLRFISGAVMFPGTYPVAEKTRLKDLINVAGLIESKAASNVVLAKSLKENDKLIKTAPKIIKIDSLMENEIILSGEFYVEVPKAVNEAINGFVNLSGEFLVPGDYAFSRTEPLSELIQRAGGLTDAAYPLGAVLERKSIKIQEKLSNEILASQLEASVLTLAQSDLKGVGEQITAVLGFSQQLRNQPTTGRMTINIMDIDNLYLQDGDKLMLPKRPSHVSVIGSVQRTTVARYGKNKTYKDYIHSAGGLTKMADVRKAYILLPNGESRLADNNTVIPVGSVLIIPPKIDKLSVLGLTDIISRVLGNIATSILAINNVN